MLARALAWFCATRLGCRIAGHPLKCFDNGIDAVWCPCGERMVTGPSLSRSTEGVIKGITG